jgi:GNAT superfamily N-acetyltransferase
MSAPRSHAITGLVESDTDLEEILALQRQNLEAALQDRRDGFVTVEHTLPILQAMHAIMPSVVARADGHVVAYALSMPRETRSLLPILAPMFERLDALLPAERFYVMGQVCVAPSHRGTGVFDALFRTHRERYAGRFDCLVTEIAVRNTRSMRAHERVGFELLERYRDATDDWALVRWRW